MGHHTFTHALCSLVEEWQLEQRGKHGSGSEAVGRAGWDAPPLHLHVMGPYGTGLRFDPHASPALLLVGGGIGVTPMASLLASLVAIHRHGDEHQKARLHASISQGQRTPM